MKKWIAGIIAIIAIAAILFGVYNSSRSYIPSEQSQTESAASANTPIGEKTLFEIDIKDFLYSSAELKIKAGSTVIWTNRDKAIHTVTSDSGGKAELNSGLMDQGETYTHNFTAVGVFNYHCNIHQMMKGKIVVE